MGVIASAPAKTILFGEHFVVYGEPAIVLAIDMRARATAKLRQDQHIYINAVDLESSGSFAGRDFQAERGDQEARMKLEPTRIAVQRVLDLSERNTGVSVEIRSSIPVAAGLGSSAAVVTAVAAAVSRLLGVHLSQEEIFKIAYEAETVVHSTPSGIDPAVSTYGGALLFDRNKGLKPLNIEANIPLVIGNTGIERSTGELVSTVHKMREQYPSIINPILKIGGQTASSAVEALKGGNLHALGELMNINHALLYAIGVSDENLERLVYAARKAGALGAKLTGIGSRGCMIALSHQDKTEMIMNAIKSAGGSAFLARITNDGVKIER